MNNFFIKIIIIIMLSMPIIAYLDEPTKPLYHIEAYFINNGINIKTKTYNGWIRVLISKTKREKYHINIPDEQIKYFINELKELKKYQIRGNIK